jgi:hypothetical protein
MSVWKQHRKQEKQLERQFIEAKRRRNAQRNEAAQVHTSRTDSSHIQSLPLCTLVCLHFVFIDKFSAIHLPRLSSHHAHFLFTLIHRTIKRLRVA